MFFVEQSRILHFILVQHDRLCCLTFSLYYLQVKMNPIYFCNTHPWSSVNTKKQMASNCNLLCLWNVLSFRPISLINLIFSLHLFSPNNQFLTVGFTRLITEINWLAINILLILRACLKAHNTVCNACRDNRDTETVSLFIFIQTTSEFLFTRIPHFGKKKKKKSVRCLQVSSPPV